MAFGHEKPDGCRAAIEYAGWACRFRECRSDGIDPDTDPDPDADGDGPKPEPATPCA